MDILAHGLWTGAVAKASNKKLKRTIKIWQAVFWGVIPDFFSFAPMFVWLFWQLVFGGLTLSEIPRPREGDPSLTSKLWIFQLSRQLYQISHSAVIFGAIFLLVWLISKKLPLAMLGWLFHILIDVPTHSPQFYPTPFLWPVSGWEFRYGISWGQPWFMIINYSAIILVYLWFYRQKHKAKK